MTIWSDCWQDFKVCFYFNVKLSMIEIYSKELLNNFIKLIPTKKPFNHSTLNNVVIVMKIFIYEQ